MKATDEIVTYVIYGKSGRPIDVVDGYRLEDRRFALRAVTERDEHVVDHITTGTKAITAETVDAVLDDFEKLLGEKGEEKLAAAVAKANDVIREYEESLA